MKNHISIPQTYSLRERLILLLFDYSKNIYRLTIKRKQKAWPLTIEKLLQFPKGSLGKDLGLFLRVQGFELEPKFEKHDIYHIITDYPTTVIGEICLGVFNVANGKRSIYTVGVALLGVLIMLEEYETFAQAYQRGKNARSYANWKFEHLLNENTEELKKHIFKQKNDLETMI